MEYIDSNSLSEHLVAFLCSARSTRRYYELLREQRIARYKQGTVRGTLSRLNKKGLIKQTNTGWQATAQGREFLSAKRRFDLIPSPFTPESKRQTIIAFDITEDKRRERTWLRDQLKVFGYKMLQRSLWQGPGPLPKEFRNRLKGMEIANGVKTFTIMPK